MISNGAGVKQYVQLTGPRPRRRARERRQVPLGLQPGGQRRRQHPDADRERRPVFASTGYQTGAALVELSKTADGRRGAARSTSSTAKTFQNHHGGMVLVGNHVYGGNGQSKGFPICIELTTGKVAWGGDIRNAGAGLRGRRLRRRQPVLPLPERRRDADRGHARGLPREGLVHDPGRREAELAAPGRSSAASSTCASRTRSTSTTSARRPEKSASGARTHVCSPG